MFGFFKKKTIEEQWLNKGLFLVNFDKFNVGTGIDTKNSSIPLKIFYFSLTLASLVSSEAKGEKYCQLKVSDSYDRAAAIIVYAQAVLAISEFIQLKDKNILTDVMNLGIPRLICIDYNNISPHELADMKLASEWHKMLTKNHLDLVYFINENILNMLLHRTDECLNNLTESWLKIVKILTK